MHAASFLRLLLGWTDIARARRGEGRRADALQADVHAELLRFEATLGGSPHEGIVLGRAVNRRGQNFWVRMLESDFFATHHWITGSTGSGKTYSAVSTLLSVLSRHPPKPVIVFDFKGELTTLLLTTILPALVAQPGGEHLLQHLRVVRPFARFAPMLNLTLPEPGVPREIQAMTIATAIEEALGADLGHRMNRAVLRLITLAIELLEPLTVVRTWLEDPTSFAQAATQSTDPSLRMYAATLRARENRASIDALLARLDAFLFLPATRRVLSAPGCVSFADALERGITIVDVGDPPAGAEGQTRFWGGALVGKLMRAVLSRPVGPDSQHAYVPFEEFQEAVGPHQMAQFARLLALARYKRVSCLFINQQPGQLDPALVKILRTNCGVEAAFRANVEDARAYAHAVALPGRVKHAAEARQALVERLTRLERRQCLLWVKEKARAQLVRSPRLDLERLRELAAQVPADVRNAIERGTVSMDPDAPAATDPRVMPEAPTADILAPRRPIGGIHLG